MPPEHPPVSTPRPEPAAQGHDHRGAPPFLPHWLQHHWTGFTVAVAGLALGVGFIGETLLGMPPSVALGFYLVSYLAGG